MNRLVDFVIYIYIKLGYYDEYTNTFDKAIITLFFVIGVFTIFLLLWFIIWTSLLHLLEYLNKGKFDYLSWKQLESKIFKTCSKYNEIETLIQRRNRINFKREVFCMLASFYTLVFICTITVFSLDYLFYPCIITNIKLIKSINPLIGIVLLILIIISARKFQKFRGSSRLGRIQK